MSTLEYIIWQTLGLAAVPVIFLSGFIAVAAISLWVLSLSKDKSSTDDAVE
ncbi:TIGR02808 family protein [Vibrio sp. SM6]|uniref:TIGR02808 family protein n=1 Tax=Vibrio agarilyticus TaxID=2726741 RepID=A0A7X8TMP1_9VIBR|nr:TIGR02808 family protein [Vibrio agarilyticus]NLS11341.1 TIGR02808 family protein [Vibrio agarilyticus]